MTMTGPALPEFGWDGCRALEWVISQSPYGTLVGAVARLAVFTHPDTVKKLDARPLFRIVRGLPRGHVTESEEGPVMRDDNTGPTDAFLHANGMRRTEYKDVQFCHIWRDSQSVEAYTNLANLVVLPAFLAKLSDTHPEIRAMLQARSYALYGWLPPSVSAPPEQPDLKVTWAEPLGAVADPLERVLKRLQRTRHSRTAKSARELGWLGSDWVPDDRIPHPDR